MHKTVYEEKEDVLQLAKRKRIYDIIQRFPGIHFRDIGRKTGLVTGLVTHHLAYLKKYALIREEKQGNTLRYFPAAFHQEDKTLLSLLRNTSIRRILLCILTYQEANQQTIAAFIGLSPQTTSWHLKKLIEKSIIQGRKKGREMFYSPTISKTTLVQLFITYKESFLDTLVDRTVEMWRL